MRRDLESPPGRAPAREEEDGAATRSLTIGLSLVVLSAAGFLFHIVQGKPILSTPEGIVSIALSTIGWAVLIYALITRHNHRRMRDG